MLRDLLLLILILGTPRLAEPRKPYTLKILELNPMTGNAPRTGYECRAASEIVVNIVNNRTDILPDYRLELVPGDEAADGIGTVNTTMRFLRGEERADNNEGTTTFVSPVMIAGYFTSGCVTIGKILHHIDMVAFSLSCGYYGLVDRVKFPNLYLSRGTSGFATQTQLRFIRSIGKWNKIAILGYMGNINDYTAAQLLNGLAVQNQVNVVHYDQFYDMDQEVTFTSLKSSGARIVVLWVSNLGIARKFLCQTYRFGITGTRYLLTIYTTMFTDPSQIPEDVLPGCTKDMIMEQYKITIAIGHVQVPIVKDVISYLGYDGNTFDVMFDKYTNVSRKDDYSFRFQCHDITLSVILTLDAAEKAMKSDNLTIRDFSSKTDQVMRFVNGSAIKLDFMGLRVGRIKYGATGQLSSDFFLAAYAGDGRTKYIGSSSIRGNATGQENDDYVYTEIVKTPWATPNGQPPRDSAASVLLVENVPQPVSVAVVILSSLSIAVTCVGIVKTLYIRQYLEKATKILAGFGCLLVNVASILFSLDIFQGNAVQLWQSRVTVLALGVSLVNGVHFGRIWLIKTMVDKVMPKNGRSTALRTNLTPTWRSANTPQSQGKTLAVPGTPKSAHSSQTNFSRPPLATPTISSFPTMKEKKTLLVAALFTAMTFSVIAVSIAADKLTCRKQKDPPKYDYALDTYFTAVKMQCESQYQAVWQYGLVAVNALLLALGCLWCYELRHRHANQLVAEFNYMAVGPLNNLAIICATVLLLVVLRRPVAQDITLAFVGIYHATTNSISLFAFLKPVSPPSEQRAPSRTKA